VSDLVEDWSDGIETWASTAQSAPQSTTPEEGLRMTPNDDASAATDDSGRTTATDRAVQAGERLMEASTKVGNAYADAYQDAVISMADFREKVGDARTVDWAKLAPHAGPAGARTNGRQLREVADTATRVNEQIVGATKQLGLAYVDAYEQLVLSAVEQREQAASASDNKWLRTAGSTHAGVARDVTRAYVDAARRLLT
jgi:hypothetical protein